MANLPASGGDRLDATGIVVRVLVDEGAHGVDGHGLRRLRAERYRPARKPRGERIRRQDDRHAVVNWLNDPIGRGREDRAGQCQSKVNQSPN